MDLFKTAGDIVDTLMHGPVWAFVAAFCVITTQFLRYAHYFPNWAIETVVVVVGTLSYALFADPAQFGERYPHLKAVMGGFMIATVSCVSSRMIMAWAFAKLSKFLPEACIPTDVTDPKQPKRQKANNNGSKNET